MRLLFLGDMVGKTGRTAVWEKLPGLVSDLKLDFVIVNGENAAGGFGITEDIFLETINAGADVVTTGNHVWDQKEAVSFCERHDQFLRPANYPAGTPGRGVGLYYARNGARVLVSNIMGRVFMHPELDDPFKAAEAILSACPLKEQADAIVADLKANGERVERLLVDGFTQTEQDALHDYVERMRANIERAQHEFEHQTSSQTPSTAAPEYSEAEVINTKEENK